MMTYRTTRQADDDIIGLYVDGHGKFGRLQADRYHEGLALAFEMIAAHPNIARERLEFDPPIRLQLYHAHLIIYRLTQNGLLIVRVLQARRNWLEIL